MKVTIQILDGEVAGNMTHNNPRVLQFRFDTKQNHLPHFLNWDQEMNLNLLTDIFYETVFFECNINIQIKKSL